jgi:hypothetical protein
MQRAVLFSALVHNFNGVLLPAAGSIAAIQLFSSHNILYEHKAAN